jgi:hypothetical protein
MNPLNGWICQMYPGTLFYFSKSKLKYRLQAGIPHIRLFINSLRTVSEIHLMKIVFQFINTSFDNGVFS